MPKKEKKNKRMPKKEILKKNQRMLKKVLPKEEEVLKQQKVFLWTKCGTPNCGGSSEEATVRP